MKIIWYPHATIRCAECRSNIGQWYPHRDGCSQAGMMPSDEELNRLRADFDKQYTFDVGVRTSPQESADDV
jgi:hypothetical protein